MTRRSSRDPARSAHGSDEMLRVQKYPNRRLYDRTHSRHLTGDQLHALIAEGRRVQVTDSRTGEDITNLVLAQLLLEHDPLKLVAFPPELLHMLIRSSHRVMPSVQRAMAEATAGLARGWEEWRTWGERLAALAGAGSASATPPPWADLRHWLPGGGLAASSDLAPAPPPDAQEPASGAGASTGKGRDDLRRRLRQLQADVASLEASLARKRSDARTPITSRGRGVRRGGADGAGRRPGK